MSKSNEAPKKNKTKQVMSIIGWVMVLLVVVAGAAPTVEGKGEGAQKQEG